MLSTTRSHRSAVSVVIPALNEADTIQLVIERTAGLLRTLGHPWEIIVVDDGSTDDTFAKMQEAAAGDTRIRALRLSRNFGSHVAITAGLEHAQGQACVVITADLEEPPEMIPAFLDKWEEHYDIVWGVRSQRTESRSVRLMSALFHRLFRAFGLSQYSEHAIGGGFFLVDERVVHSLRQMRERNRTLVGLLSWTGFRQGFVSYPPQARHSGTSKWTVGKRVKLAIDSFVSFSYAPIRAVSVLGMGMSALSFLYGLGIIVAALLGGVAVQGWPTLMATILFLSGLQLLVSGMMGEYIWRALDEARARPLYIVAESIGFLPGEVSKPEYVAS